MCKCMDSIDSLFHRLIVSAANLNHRRAAVLFDCSLCRFFHLFANKHQQLSLAVCRKNADIVVCFLRVLSEFEHVPENVDSASCNRHRRAEFNRFFHRIWICVVAVLYDGIFSMEHFASTKKRLHVLDALHYLCWRKTEQFAQCNCSLRVLVIIFSRKRKDSRLPAYNERRAVKSLVLYKFYGGIMCTFTVVDDFSFDTRSKVFCKVIVIRNNGDAVFAKVIEYIRLLSGDILPAAKNADVRGADVRYDCILRFEHRGDFLDFVDTVHAHLKKAHLMFRADGEYRKWKSRFTVKVALVSDDRVFLRENCGGDFLCRRLAA